MTRILEVLKIVPVQAPLKAPLATLTASILQINYTSLGRQGGPCFEKTPHTITPLSDSSQGSAVKGLGFSGIEGLGLRV